MVTNITNPRITVLLSVYNGEEYLKEAIESILSQTFKDFEFLIINDGSIDSSEKIITSCNDSRIRLIRNDGNLGLIASLNKGIGLAKGKYIVRMDADDISLPTRLEKQFNFMENNPDIGICGSWVKTFSSNKTHLWKYSEKSNNIKADLFFLCPFAHPTVIFNKAMFEKHNLGYSTEFPCSEDYELWVRASELMEFYNYPEVLLHYRRHNNQVSKEKYSIQQDYSRKARGKLFERLKLQPTEEELGIHDSLIYRKFGRTKKYIEEAEKWLSKLVEANNKIGAFEKTAFNKKMAERWFLACRKSSAIGYCAWRSYEKSELSKNAQIPSEKLFLFWLTSALKIKG